MTLYPKGYNMAYEQSIGRGQAVAQFFRQFHCLSDVVFIFLNFIYRKYSDFSQQGNGERGEFTNIAKA